MGRDLEQHTALARGLEHETEIVLLEIADAAVDEPRGLRRRPAAEVALLDQRGAEAAQRRVAPDPRARDAAAEHEEAHPVRGHRLHCRARVPTVARQVSRLPQFPKDARAYSLSRACAPAAQAVANSHDEIALGRAAVVLAGGVEALSDIPILASRRLADILVEAGKAKSVGARLRTLSRIRPRDLIPVSPAIAEPSTGESMGQSAEKMAKENHISRAAQDRW